MSFLKDEMISDAVLEKTREVTNRVNAANLATECRKQERLAAERLTANAALERKAENFTQVFERETEAKRDVEIRLAQAEARVQQLEKMAKGGPSDLHVDGGDDPMKSLNQKVRT